MKFNIFFPVKYRIIKAKESYSSFFWIQEKRLSHLFYYQWRNIGNSSTVEDAIKYLEDYKLKEDSEPNVVYEDDKNNRRTNV